MKNELLEKLFSRFFGVLYRSLFLRRDTGVNSASLESKLLLFFSLAVLQAITSIYRPLPIVFLILLFVVFENRLKHLLLISLFSAIPAAWLSLTGWVTYCLAQGECFISLLVNVFYNAEIYSIIIMSLVHALRPDDTYRLLSRLTSIKIYPYIAWRVVPQVMSDAEVALYISNLKKEKAWKALTITLASQIERGERIKAANHMLIESSRGFHRIHGERETRITYLLALAEILAILCILIFH